MDAAEVESVVTEVFPEIDGDLSSYFASIVLDQGCSDRETITSTLAPFIDSYGLIPGAHGFASAEDACSALLDRLQSRGLCDAVTHNEELQLLEKTQSFQEMSKGLISESEQKLTDALWGFDKIRGKRNETIEVNEAGSAKYERKAMKEQKKWLDQLDAKFQGDAEDSAQISSMTLPDLSGNNREKDIHVKNFNITFGGQLLLDGADLRIVYGRRFGLIGKNGVGKTTLLRHMASFDIEGFPRHHRVLHVKQEVRASERSVLDVVLAADVEREHLLAREKDLVARQQECSDPAEHAKLSEELAAVYDRLSLISADSAEARAASILTGLRFSAEMQRESTSKLSGGWKMRVALAGALFIEP